MDFKAGDVVMLKSGGPKMTIDKIRSGDSGNIATCVWFEDNQPKELRVSLETLQKAV